MITGLFPTTAMASQSNSFDQEFAMYLEEVSEERGFDVTRDDIEASLAYYDESMDSFDRVEDIRDYLGDVIQADLSNLGFIYEAYELDEAALTQLLRDNGEDLNDYVFTYDLYEAVYFYTGTGVVEQEADFDRKLTDYLAEVSTTRGFEITKAALESSLSTYGSSMKDFKTVAELKEFLGDVIEADLSNLDYFSTNYGMDSQSVLHLVADNGKSIEDFIYISDLEYFVLSKGDISIPGFNLDEIMSYLNLIGITEDEFKQLENHFMSLTDLFNDPSVLQQVEDLAYRAEAIAEQVGDAGPTKAQMGELISIYNEYLTMFQLKINVILINDGVEVPVSLTDLMTMTDLEGIDGMKLEFYNTDSKLLADMLVTSELLESGLGGLLEGTTDEIIDVVDEVSSNQDDNSTNQVSTAKGAKLPKTASDYTLNTLLGLGIALAGTLIYRKVRIDKVEKDMDI
jgi:processed acidic surface protein